MQGAADEEGEDVAGKVCRIEVLKDANGTILDVLSCTSWALARSQAQVPLDGSCRCKSIAYRLQDLPEVARPQDILPSMRALEVQEDVELAAGVLQDYITSKRAARRVRSFTRSHETANPALNALADLLMWKAIIRRRLESLRRFP